MSEFGCLTSVHYDPSQKLYLGKNAATGETRIFQTLGDYQRFLSNLEKAGHVCPDVSVPNPYVTPFRRHVDYKQDPSPQFMEFKVENPCAQAKYDPMFPTWQGVGATLKAIRDGVYKKDAVFFYNAGDMTSPQGMDAVLHPFKYGAPTLGKHPGHVQDPAKQTGSGSSR